MAALWLSSIRRRRAAALGVFVIVAIACAAAVAGPMLVRSAEQSGFRSTLHDASPGEYDIVVSATATNGYPVDQVAALLARAASAAGRTLFDRPVVVTSTEQPLHWHLAGRTGTGSAVELTNGCAMVVVTAGHCPAATGQLLLPALAGIRPGQHIAVDGQPHLEVSGTYRPGSLPGWLTGFGARPVLSPVRTLEQFDPTPNIAAYDHLRTGALDLDTLATAMHADLAVRAAVIGQPIVSAATSNIALLAGATHADGAVTDVVGLITVVPLVLLSWYSLVLMLQLIASVRSREWALGRLRGLTVPVWLRSLYSEPAALLVVGAPCGFALGVAVAAATARMTMYPGTPIEPTRAPVLISFAITVFGAVLGIMIATLRGLRVPLATLLQQSAEPHRLTRTGVAAQVVVIAAAVLSIVQLASQRQVSVGPGNLGLLLPGLLACVLSLLVIRLSAGSVRRSSGAPPRSVRGLVIGRRLARNPALLNRYLVVAVASAGIVFAVSLVAIMQRNVAARAGNQLGASAVVRVGPVTPDRLMAAVRAADPSGHHAMAVEQLAGPVFGGTSRVVAVDATRLSAVSDWDPRWAALTPGASERLLDPPHGPSLVLRGTELSLGYADATATIAPFNVDPTAPVPRPHIVAVVFVGGRWLDVSLGNLTPGHATRRSPIPCASGCVLRTIGFDNPSSTPYSGEVTITSLATDRQSADIFRPWLTRSGRWQNEVVGAEPGTPVRTVPRATSAGLRVSFRDYAGSSTAALQPADGPDIVPAIAAAATDAAPLPAFHHAVDGTGLDGSQLPLRIVARATALPSSVDDGVMVDLSAIARFSDPAKSQAQAQVWLGPGTAHSVVAGLRRAGLHILAIEHTKAISDQLLSTAPVRVVIADAAVITLLALLAAAAVAAAAATDVERRKSFTRLLRDVGFTDRTVRRFCFAEVALPAGLAVVAGVVAASVAVLVAGPRLPLFASTAGPPLATAPPWSAVIAVAATLVVLVLATGVVLSATTARASRSTT